MKNYSWPKIVQEWLFPAVCCLCRATGQTGLDLCTICHRRIRSVERPCLRCGLPLPDTLASHGHPASHCGFCLRYRHQVDNCCAPLEYADPLSRLVAGFKYHQQLHQGRLLSQLMIPALKAHYRDQQLDWPHLLIPVPLHPARLRQRGFNQALELARWLGKDLGLKAQPRVIRRHSQGPDQHTLNARERRANLRNVFSVSSPSFIAGCNLAIVDDVITTLSTVSVMAALLKQHGAQRVDVWAPARTLHD